MQAVKVVAKKLYKKTAEKLEQVKQKLVAVTRVEQETLSIGWPEAESFRHTNGVFDSKISTLYVSNTDCLEQYVLLNENIKVKLGGQKVVPEKMKVVKETVFPLVAATVVSVKEVVETEQVVVATVVTVAQTVETKSVAREAETVEEKPSTQTAVADTVSFLKGVLHHRKSVMQSSTDEEEEETETQSESSESNEPLRGSVQVDEVATTESTDVPPPPPAPAVNMVPSVRLVVNKQSNPIVVRNKGLDLDELIRVRSQLRHTQDPQSLLVKNKTQKATMANVLSNAIEKVGLMEKYDSVKTEEEDYDPEWD